VWMTIALASASAARAEDPAPGNDTEPRWVDPWDRSESYRTVRAGESFRTSLFGYDASIEPRDRRSTSALDLGVAGYIRAPEGARAIPFGSLYFWRRPDE